MAVKRKAAAEAAKKPARTERDDSAAVTAHLRALEHPLKTVVEGIRSAILKADESITEGIKWNSASFYRNGWFATANARGNAVQVVMHHGAKARKDATLSKTIKDPSQLLKWLAPDRAVIAFTSEDDFKAKRAAFADIIRQWAAYQARL